jgi:hypothetical protein
LGKSTLLYGKITSVKVKANGFAVVSHKIVDRNHTKYAIEVQSLFGSMKIYAVNSVHRTESIPALYYSDIIKQNDGLYALACIKNSISSSESTGNIVVDINFSDSQGFSIPGDTYTYAIKKIGTEAKEYRVSMNLFDSKGNLIKSTDNTYSCKNKKSLCTNSVVSALSEPIMIFVLVGLAIIATIAVVYVKHRHNRIIV